MAGEWIACQSDSPISEKEGQDAVVLIDGCERFLKSIILSVSFFCLRTDFNLNILLLFKKLI